VEIACHSTGPSVAKVLSSRGLLNVNQVSDFRENPPDSRRIVMNDRLMHAPETERRHVQLLIGGPANEAPNLRNF
jgi:hypothetical protein